MTPTAGAAAFVTKVSGIRNLTDSTYALRFDRGNLDFEPGQYVSVGVRGDIDMREYSIYSSPGDDYLEILVKEIEHGYVSSRLRALTSGAEIEIEGPFGFFTIDAEVRRSDTLLFIATGTGISPFHSLVRAYPGLDYQLLHGVRTLEERYDHAVFDPTRIVACVSREPIDGRGGAESSASNLFQGRVTDFVRLRPPRCDTYCYLCGNCDMIYETFDILKGHGVAPGQLFAEVYF